MSEKCYVIVEFAGRSSREKKRERKGERKRVRGEREREDDHDKST